MADSSNLISSSHKLIKWVQSQNPDLDTSSTDQVLEAVALSLEQRGVAPWNSYAGTSLEDIRSGINISDLAIFPVKDTLTYKMFLEQVASLWTADELDFNADAADYLKMSPNNKRMYRLIVGFFHVADAVISAQAKNFLTEAQTMSEEAFLAAQLYIEIQHQMAYGLAAEHVIRNREELEEARRECFEAPCVMSKWDFVIKHRNSARSLGYRYFAGALAEGVFFAALFSIIFYFRKKNIMRAFCDANQWIMRDETYHRDFNCAMARRYGGFTIEDAHNMCCEAYEVEVAHIRHLLAEPFDDADADAAGNLTVATLEQYVASLVDQVLILCGLPTLFKVENPNMPWMVGIGLNLKPNFYETTVTAYSQSCVKDGILRSEGAEGADKLAAITEQAILNPEDVDF